MSTRLNDTIVRGKVAYWIFFKREVAIPSSQICAVMQLHPRKRNTHTPCIQKKYTPHVWEHVFGTILPQVILSRCS